MKADISTLNKNIMQNLRPLKEVDLSWIPYHERERVNYS